MIRICARIALRQSFCSSKFKLPTSDYDLANVTGLIQSQIAPSLTFFEKISYLFPTNLYYNLDEFSRDMLLAIANDYQVGLPFSVMLISLMIKGVFFIPSLKSQAMALKMQDAKPIMDKFQQKMKVAQMSRNMAIMKQAKRQFSEEKKKRGIDNFYAFFNILQIPFLITWFISLRHMTSLPQVFPQVQQSFLWMDDLSSFDPYFILPLISAFVTSYSIIISPSMNRKVAMPLFAPIMKYMKFLPFISLPITAFFPGLINLYWVTMSTCQLLLNASLNTTFMKKKFGMYKEEPVSQIAKAAIIEDSTEKIKIIHQPNLHQAVQQVKVLSKRSKKKKTQQ